jgi:hypothetical protein
MRSRKATLMRKTRRLALASVLPLLAACVVDSRWPRIETQKAPAPMESVGLSLGGGELHGIITSEPGSEEVTVMRYGDPVQVRPAGRTAAYPLAFHDKEVLLNAGCWVLCNPGGKVEILWKKGTSVLLSGRTTGLVGSHSRGEPTFAFVEIDKALLNLRKGDEVRLVGGAMISAEVGPLAVEGLDSGILRVENQSKEAARIRFREMSFVLEPGEEIHLPLLSPGIGDWGASSDRRSYGKQGMLVEVEGVAQALPHPEGVLIVPGGDHEIRGMGLRLQLAEGEELLVRGVNMGRGAVPVPDAMPKPEPEAANVPEPEKEQQEEPEKEGAWVPGGEAGDHRSVGDDSTDEDVGE